ncbi:MAG: hypothetical protein QGG40_16455, partial [Myxococcota bacterium]|nr:hypothetical protein [Myxococcota bacterium]
GGWVAGGWVAGGWVAGGWVAGGWVAGGWVAGDLLCEEDASEAELGSSKSFPRPRSRSTRPWG